MIPSQLKKYYNTILPEVDEDTSTVEFRPANIRMTMPITLSASTPNTKQLVNDTKVT